MKLSIMTFNELINRSFNMHRENFKSATLYIFLFRLVAMFGGGVIFGISAIVFGIFITISRNAVMSGIIVGIVILLLYIAIAIFFLLEQAGMIVMAKKDLQNKKLDSGTMLNKAVEAFPKVASVVIVWVLLFIPILIFFVAVFIVFNMAYVNGNMLVNDMAIGQIILNIIIILVFFMTITYYTTIHMFSLHVSMIENKYFFKALKRSRSLVKDNFWHIFWRTFLISIIVAIIAYSLYAVIGLVAIIGSILQYFIQITPEMMQIFGILYYVIGIPLQFIASVFISPFYGISTTLLYLNQRFKKEGYDIELRLNRLEKDKVDGEEVFT